jgi:threonine synthase
MRIPAQALAVMRDHFVSYATDEDATGDEIRRHLKETDALIDPHTAVARVGARALREEGGLEGRIVTLSTAHPAKFPDAVRAATGRTPALPPAYEDLFERREYLDFAPAETTAVAAMIADRFAC